MDAATKSIDWSHLQSQLVAGVEDDKLTKFCTDLHVSTDAARLLGIGRDHSKKAWTFPERTDEAEIVGLSVRPEKGKKFMVTGSSHGLFYMPDPSFGGVPAYLDRPILIVEGATDVMAAFDGGFYAIGKPSATGTKESNAYLQKLVKGRDIALLGENDGGIGLMAILDQAKRLQPHAASVRTVYCPKFIKDLRAWKANSDTWVDEVIKALEAPPWSSDDIQVIAGDVLFDTAPVRVGENLILEKFTAAGRSTLRQWNGLWFHFNGRTYENVDDQFVRMNAYKWLDSKMVIEIIKDEKGDISKEVPFRPDAAKVNRVIDAIEASPKVYVHPNTLMPSWLDGREYPPVRDIVAFRNGILDVPAFVAGKVRFIQPDPTLFSQSFCPYDFDADADCGPWLECLNGIFSGDEDSIKLLQEWFGYNMVTDTTFEKFMMMVGRPGAGKGTVLDVFTKVVGPSNTAASSISALGSQFGLQPLLGKTVCVLHDAHVTNFEKATMALEVLKTITGRGDIHVDKKGVQAQSTAMPIRFTVSVNELPNFTDTAAALRRRLMVMWFPNSFEGREDVGLKDRLMSEKTIQGVAVWALEGLRRLRAFRKFTVPSVSKAISQEFERLNTPVNSFIQDECVVGPLETVGKRDIYEAWSAWCKSKGQKDGHAAQFGQRLLAAVPILRSRRGGRDNRGHREQFYEGIRLRNFADGDADE